MEANTPGQNTLSGMSGHDSRRLLTTSHSGERHPVVPKFLNMCYRRGLMQRFLAARNESEPIMYKSNQMHPMQELYFTIGDENPHGSRLSSLPSVLFLVYVKKIKEVYLLREKDQNRMNHV